MTRALLGFRLACAGPLVLLALGVGGHDRTLAAQTPKDQDKSQVFRAGVEVVSLNVTVVNTQNRYVTDLTEGDFSVFEDGAKQDLTFFNRTNLPIAMSLLLDTSASME